MIPQDLTRHYNRTCDEGGCTLRALEAVVTTVLPILSLSERSILETVRAGEAVNGGRNAVRTSGEFTVSAEVKLAKRRHLGAGTSIHNQGLGIN